MPGSGSDNYWLRRRLGRRTALKGAVIAGAGLAGAAAFGCGGNESNQSTGSTEPVDKSGLLARPVNTTDKAVPGSVYQSYTGSDLTHFDSLAATDFQSATYSIYSYSMLVKYKVGSSDKRADGSVEGDAAVSWEIPGDGTQVVFKIRPDMKFDPRAPTNGRALTANDVVKSWEKYSQKSNARSDMNNAINNQAPIKSFEAPDDKTVVVKLAFPYAPILQMMAFSRYVMVQPFPEADGAFDPRRDVRGSGAWMLTKYTPSGGFEYRKNPNWYEKTRPYLDGIDIPIVPEYATQLAQFKAGNIWSGVVRQEDILRTKGDHPSLELRQSSTFSRTPGAIMYFGYNPGSPFLDERVRKAASMLMDRQLYVETVNNVKNFTDAGLTVPTRWHSHIASGEEAAWLDPQGKELGGNFQYDPAEARKLLTAAGAKIPIEADMTWFASGQYGATWPKYNELWKGMLEQDGLFRLKANVVDYQTVWLPQYLYGYSAGNKPGFNGVTLSLTTTFPDVDAYVFAMDHSKGQYIRRPESMYDARMDEILEKERREFDFKKRMDLVKEYQRYAASKMYDFPVSGQALGFALNWPWVGNAGVYNAWAQDAAAQTSTTYLWYDKSKRAS